MESVEPVHRLEKDAPLRRPQVRLGAHHVDAQQQQPVAGGSQRSPGAHLRQNAPHSRPPARLPRDFTRLRLEQLGAGLRAAPDPRGDPGGEREAARGDSHGGVPPAAGIEPRAGRKQRRNRGRSLSQHLRLPRADSSGGVGLTGLALREPQN